MTPLDQRTYLVGQIIAAFIGTGRFELIPTDNLARRAIALADATIKQMDTGPAIPTPDGKYATQK